MECIDFLCCRNLKQNQEMKKSLFLLVCPFVRGEFVYFLQ